MLNLEKFVEIIFRSKGLVPVVEVSEEGRELIEDEVSDLIRKNLIGHEYGVPDRDFSFSQSQRELGVTKKVKLLRDNKNISIAVEISAVEETPWHDVKMKVVLLDNRYRYSIEHEVLVISETCVAEENIPDCVKNMLSDIPELLGQLIHDF